MQVPYYRTCPANLGMAVSSRSHHCRSGLHRPPWHADGGPCVGSAHLSTDEARPIFWGQCWRRGRYSYESPSAWVARQLAHKMCTWQLNQYVIQQNRVRFTLNRVICTGHGLKTLLRNAMFCNLQSLADKEKQRPVDSHKVCTSGQVRCYEGWSIAASAS